MVGIRMRNCQMSKEYMLTLFDTCYGHTPEEYNSSISRITLAYYFKYALILFWW